MEASIAGESLIHTSSSAVVSCYAAAMRKLCGCYAMSRLQNPIVERSAMQRKAMIIQCRGNTRYDVIDDSIHFGPATPPERWTKTEHKDSTDLKRPLAWGLISLLFVAMILGTLTLGRSRD